jgi:hypothetical protein
VTVKIRRHDFSTHTRSTSLPGPTDDARVVTRLAATLLTEMDVSGGVRLVGVGVSSLAEWTQADLFSAYPADDEAEDERLSAALAVNAADRRPAARSAVDRGNGRRAWSIRARLGLGVRRRPGDHPVRDRSDPPWTRADLRGQRPAAHCAGARNLTRAPGAS